jgi:prepilin peptidase CpaA
LLYKGELMIIYLKFSCALLGLIFAVAWDLAKRRIPNWIILFFLASALIFNVWEAGLQGLLQALIGFVTGLALLFVPFVMGGMGAGDVKLLAGVGALWGPKFALATFLLGAVAGGVIAICYVLRDLLGSAISERNLLLAVTIPKGQLRELGRQRFPYAISIALGAVGAYLWLFVAVGG